MLGSLPIALALGAGSKSRISLGIVIIGGLIFALSLTLFVIPAMYVYLSTDRHVKTIEELMGDEGKSEEVKVKSEAV
jgi:Cu/Ag efflux pump CusA